MCPHRINDFSLLLQLQELSYKRMMYWSLLLIFIFTLLPDSLPAQGRGEDYAAVKSWQLPKTAVLSSELNEAEGVLMQGTQAFTGWAYELYPDGRLLRAAEYRKGLLHGLNLLWYPDGAPQMSASYQRGALHGRFLGWYANGGMIYDMYINRGTYAADILADKDEGRVRTETEVTEGEGRDNDNTPE